MLEDPLWEWAGGDPARAARYRAAYGFFIGMASLLLLLLFLTVLATVYPAAGPGFLLWPLLIGNLSLIAAQILFTSLVPGRSPIVGRLGISPYGLYLAIPPRALRVPWTGLRRLGPDWVEVAHPNAIGDQRFRLTPYQARRLSAFIGDPALDQLLRSFPQAGPTY
jgi:hypothetical protein